MFEDAEDQLKRIIALSEKCPAPLQEKCFEILLQAYVDSKAVAPVTPSVIPPVTNPVVAAPLAQPAAPVSIPETIRQRFAAMAARLKLTQPQLAALFDFQADPFTYHALAVPGGGKPQKTRNVALLAAAKTYLATGNWSADWKEFRAMCIDQSCFDQGNVHTYLKDASFKSASATEGITLSSAGVAAAEALVASLANPSKENDSSK